MVFWKNHTFHGLLFLLLARMGRVLIKFPSLVIAQCSKAKCYLPSQLSADLCSLVVVGLYNPAFEKTRRKIAERRMLTLREVGEKTAAAREVKGFWGQVLKGLEYNGMLYFQPF
jgi:hypothetical protein